ncbi:MAG: hypothetical protein KJ559_03075 [Nanoarchaeota archaeon]|nr:hypothetical protein [Nanoarchaeota archaeon]
MGIYKGQTPHIVEGLYMCNGKYHKVWKTNFNMPVSYLWCGNYTMCHGWVSSYDGIMESTSRALAANGICPGFEVAESIVTYWWCVTDGSSLVGNGCLRQCWTRGSTVFVSAATPAYINISTPGPGYWQWQFWQMAYMTGLDSDEVCIDSYYCADTRVQQVSGNDVSIPNCNLNLYWGDVPSTARCSSTYMGTIWVDGSDLHFINRNCWEHKMIGNYIGSGGTPGAIYIDTNHYINWVGCTGNIYRACWRLCQFCSTFSNSSGPNPNPGAGYAGALWMDGEFGWTHLAYIGCDGAKYITGAGRDPIE